MKTFLGTLIVLIVIYFIQLIGFHIFKYFSPYVVDENDLSDRVIGFFLGLLIIAIIALIIIIGYDIGIYLKL